MGFLNPANYEPLSARKDCLWRCVETERMDFLKPLTSTHA
jgi:hypothetical protein